MTTAVDSELKKKVEGIYTPLSVAKEEIWRRWNDKALRKKVEDFLEGDVLYMLRNTPKATLVRYITTPNLELSYFLDLAKITGLDYSLLEYSRDKFVSKNPDKYSLCKMSFFDGIGKKGGVKSSRINVVNFNKTEGKLLDCLDTLWGEKLIDFHHRIIKQSMGEEVKEKIFDISDWFDEKRNKNRDFYYLHYLSLFVCHGVLFENFLLDKGEIEFTLKKVLPSFAKVEEIFGVKPLIVPLEPFKDETDCAWRSYSKNIKELINYPSDASSVSARITFSGLLARVDG